MFAFALEVVRILGMPPDLGKSFFKKNFQANQTLGAIGGGRRKPEGE
jgi:hypothetical protein